MRWLNLAEVLDLHRQLIEQNGGSPGIRDLGLLEASLAQPWQTFGGMDLYPDFLQGTSNNRDSLVIERH